jgi:redox-sensitive bicupin YhaK (pirin superfamily)
MDRVTFLDYLLSMIIKTGSTHDLGGGFVVRRLLPFRKKTMVGPFIFLDHMGPFEFVPVPHSDIRPHPHIGLSTLTYLYDGRMVHRDSLANEQVIKPGEVNWMTAGKGIVHSERIHKDDHNKKIKMEGLQFWVALPDDLEDQDPSFLHYEEPSIPVFKGKGFRVAVIGGKAFDLLSPVQVSSPLVFLNFEVSDDAEIPFKAEKADFEIALYVLKGEVHCEGQTLKSGQLGVLKKSSTYGFKAKKDTRFVLIGGEPFKSHRFIEWNFVSSSKEKIEAASRDWQDEKFPLIPGDDKERIPLGD